MLSWYSQTCADAVFVSLTFIDYSMIISLSDFHLFAGNYCQIYQIYSL